MENKKKPTIAELEKILAGPNPSIEIMPDGSIRAKTCPNCEALRGQVVRMREALLGSKKLLDDLDPASWLEDPDDQDVFEATCKATDKALSQTQDVSAWHQASLLRAEADGMGGAALAIEVESEHCCEDCPCGGWIDDLKNRAAAIRKQADELTGEK